MKHLAILVLAASLAACASGYKPEGLGGGFSETQLAPNVWRVSFRGNGVTKPERAADLNLLRSAELALSGGFSHFAVVNGSTRVSYAASTTPVTATTVGNRTTVSGGDTMIVEKPSTTNTIVCFDGDPRNGLLVYDAKFLVASLKKKYSLD